jgi:arylsulfatase A-like enzyme
MNGAGVLKRARVLALAVCLGLTVLGVGCSSERGIDPSPQRVLLLTVDTLRADHLSINGYDLPTTPYLDGLVSRGTRFDAAITPVPRTTQALASLLTGTYPHTHRVRVLFDRLPGRIPTLPELARGRGYRTVAVVSNHLLVPERGLARGFDIYDSAPDKREAQATTQAVIARLREISPADPIFLWVHYIDPHVPYYPPAELASEFDPGYRGSYRLHFGGIKGGLGKRAYPRNLGKEKAVFHNSLSERVNAHIRRLYAADIRATDDAIRELVEWLFAELGPEWLIVFASDHGEALGEHDYFYDHGDYLYQGSLRVPMAIVMPEDLAPGGGRSRVVKDPVSLVDVMPTLSELLGLTVESSAPFEIEGSSLVPYLEGGSLPPRAVFGESGKSFFPDSVRGRTRFDLSGRFRAVIEGSWKLIWTPGAPPEQEYQLYDLDADPDERQNLSHPDHPELTRLRERLHDWLRDDATEAAQPSAEDEERLRALGYIE